MQQSVAASEAGACLGHDACVSVRRCSATSTLRKVKTPVNVLFLFQMWEVIVINQLQWNFCAMTTHDFVDQYMERVKCDVIRKELLRRHAKTFLDLAYIEGNYNMSIHLKYMYKFITLLNCRR